MGKLKLASKLADEVGVSVAKAGRFIDDVGANKAQKVADEAATTTNGGSSLSKWARPAFLTGGLAGGGALIWRQQDVQKARSVAKQSENYQQAVKKIVESDLPPEMKEKMIEDASEAANIDDDENKDDDGSLIPDDPVTLIVLVIVMAVVLKATLDGDD